MKKCILSLLFVGAISICGLLSFAEGAKADRVGAILGLPTGLSYSHNFTDVDQLDLTLAVFPGHFLVGYGDHYYGRYAVDFALGYLRSVARPNVNGAEAPVEIGGGLSFTTVSPRSSYVWMTMYFDFRWEIFFASAPTFALFVDLSPGVGIFLHSNPYAYFAPRCGLGLRAVL